MKRIIKPAVAVLGMLVLADRDANALTTNITMPTSSQCAGTSSSYGDVTETGQYSGSSSSGAIQTTDPSKPILARASFTNEPDFGLSLDIISDADAAQACSTDISLKSNGYLSITPCNVICIAPGGKGLGVKLTCTEKSGGSLSFTGTITNGTGTTSISGTGSVAVIKKCAPGGFGLPGGNLKARQNRIKWVCNKMADAIFWNIIRNQNAWCPRNL